MESQMERDTNWVYIEVRNDCVGFAVRVMPPTYKSLKQG